jgi:hypothetical protein
MGLLYRNTRTSWVSVALLCAHISPDPLRRVLYQKIPWSRRLWDFFAHGLVQRGGYLVIEVKSLVSCNLELGSRRGTSTGMDCL